MWRRTDPRTAIAAGRQGRLPHPDSGELRWSGGAGVPACPRRRAFAGFTLIEILVVITVIAILAALVTPMVFRNVGDAKISAARAQIEILGLALDSYRLDNDYYPSSVQGLGALQAIPTGDPAARNWRGPYLKKAVPLDPWGRPYQYRSPGEINPTSYDLLSLGRNGTPGGEGEDADITSWESDLRQTAPIGASQ